MILKNNPPYRPLLCTLKNKYFLITIFLKREREERRRNKNKINIIRNKRDENILKTINLLILLENIHY